MHRKRKQLRGSIQRPIEQEKDESEIEVDCDKVKRIEILDDDPNDVRVEGDTLYVGRNFFNEAKVNDATGALYFEEGHPLYEYFSHNCPIK